MKALFANFIVKLPDDFSGNISDALEFASQQIKLKNPKEQAIAIRSDEITIKFLIEGFQKSLEKEKKLFGCFSLSDGDFKKGWEKI